MRIEENSSIHIPNDIIGRQHRAKFPSRFAQKVAIWKPDLNASDDGNSHGISVRTLPRPI
ncbi:hypothetical protein AAMO2058_001732400 [Amorphochlora amoebiformis]